MEFFYGFNPKYPRNPKKKCQKSEFDFNIDVYNFGTKVQILMVEHAFESYGP